MYSLGVSEEITGRALKDFAKRDDVVIASKVFYPMGDKPHQRGFSRQDTTGGPKAMYVGASSMYAYQFAQALHLQDLHGWSRFVSMQNHYNLIYREEEREMMPLCRAEGIGVIPWSHLARWLLTRA